MDCQYNIRRAAMRLEELAAERYHSSHSETQLSRITSVSAHYEAFKTNNDWRLITKNTNEEVVALIQGIIFKQDLPPFKDKIGKMTSRVRYLHQSLSISYYDTPTFGKAVNAILDIHTTLGRAVGLKDLLDCAIVSTVDNHPVCDMSNRYFSSQSANTSPAEKMQLSPDIDPYGHLSRAGLAAGLYHSKENAVAYFERIGDKGSNYKYLPAKPAVFSIGDIIEVQVSFVMFPLKDHKFKTSMVLRGITLLDGRFTQERMQNIYKSQLQLPKMIFLKRKVGYGEEEVSATRAKMEKMEIDKNGKEPEEGEVDSDAQA